MILFSDPIPVSANASCIYAILNICNGMYYIGSATIAHKRFAKHRSLLRSGKHENTHLQSAYKKYGESNFVFIIIEICSKLVVLIKEQSFIDQFNAASNSVGYNVCPVSGSRLGTIFSDEYKKAMSERLRKIHLENPEIAKRAGIKRRGRRLSNEHIEKVVCGCSKNFSLISPGGMVFTGTNRASFCREHGLSKAAISQLINGKYPCSKYKGWSINRQDVNT